MENRLKRRPIVEGDENERKRQIRAEYDHLMMGCEFGCHRAAMMCYEEAASYDNNVYRMEIAAAFFGVSLSAVMGWVQQWTDLGWLALIGAALACMVYIVAKGSERLLPFMSRRANIFTVAGAGWQRLAQKTRSYRISLDIPSMNEEKTRRRCMVVKTSTPYTRGELTRPDLKAATASTKYSRYNEWYRELMDDRQKLCEQVTIPKKKYDKFNQQDHVVKKWRDRRTLFKAVLDDESSTE